MKKSKFILVGFILLSIINLIAVLSEWRIGVFVTKPLLMAFLSIWFYLNTKNNFNSFSKLILFGIIFSIAGDTFLMFVDKNPDFFLYGLGSFLITHVLYIIAFSKFSDLKNGIIVKKTWLLIPVVIYLYSFMFYLWPDIPDTFKVPVFIYSSIISIMLLSCINMKWRVAGTITNFLIIGALLFVFSDSMIALNKFKTLPFSSSMMGFIIMATYISGQYLIAKSCININRSI